MKKLLFSLAAMVLLSIAFGYFVAQPLGVWGRNIANEKYLLLEPVVFIGLLYPTAWFLAHLIVGATNKLFDKKETCEI